MSMQVRLQQEKEKEQELKEQVRLAQEALKGLQEQLLIQQGAIKMLEELLQYSPINTVNSKQSSSEGASLENQRARRSTKDDMQVRKRAVIKVLFENGNCTANEMLTEVNALLPYDIKIHHLRNVLKKFTSEFEKGEDHGVWCLTNDARNKYASQGDDYSDDESSSNS
jgi:hypothetical protein